MLYLHVYSVWWYSENKNWNQDVFWSIRWWSFIKRWLSSPNISAVYTFNPSSLLLSLSPSLPLSLSLSPSCPRSLLYLPPFLPPFLPPMYAPPPSPLSANKAKVLYGIPCDPDVLTALAELEEEENEVGMEEEKPKVGNKRKNCCTIKSWYA